MTKESCCTSLQSSCLEECIGVTDNTTGMMPILAHGQESHVEPHFDHLDIRNAVVPLMMSLVSLDADAGANDIT